jgi:hypothetical protein
MTKKVASLTLLVALALATSPAGSDSRFLRDGRAIFRYDTFGDERFWTGTLRIHEVIPAAVSPVTALAVGLKVDATVLPKDFLATRDLDDPATTVELIGRRAVLGVMGRVEDGRLLSVGITCALCHSTVDDSSAPGIGRRLDGWPNRDLDPGAIIALSPALAEEQKAVYRSWGPGRFDPRFNHDGINFPVLIPPAYGLQWVGYETYTGDGPISYWNAYVAVTEMGGQGSFHDPRLGISVRQEPDLVTPKLPALLAYQLTLRAPEPPAGSFDRHAARRGRAVFRGKARCATCHAGPAFTDVLDFRRPFRPRLHEPAETGMEALYASRSATGAYRTTPLRALWQHPPYFHDGSAADLPAVVEHYDRYLGLSLTDRQKADLVEYLKSL